MGESDSVDQALGCQLADLFFLNVYAGKAGNRIAAEAAVLIGNDGDVPGNFDSRFMEIPHGTHGQFSVGSNNAVRAAS